MASLSTSTSVSHGRSGRPAAEYILMCFQAVSLWVKQTIYPASIKNFFRVSEHLYRGAQPSFASIRNLKKLGVATIINLRASKENDREKSFVEQLGMKYHSIPISCEIPDRSHYLEFLKIVKETKKGAVFVHCFFGADRTGFMIALYRILIQGWTRRQAIDEMVYGGFSHHRHWHPNLSATLEQLDLDSIRQEIAPSKWRTFISAFKRAWKAILPQK